MALETGHHVDKSITRLFCYLSDVEGLPPQGVDLPRGGASPAHQSLYAELVERLTAVLPTCERWWAGIIDAQQEGDEEASREDAIDSAMMEHLAGPATHPDFVTVIREVWLRCDALNQAAAENERVLPQSLLLRWLVEDGKTELVQLVTCMPYWPLGLDASGRWC